MILEVQTRILIVFLLKGGEDSLNRCFFSVARNRKSMRSKKDADRSLTSGVTVQ